MHPLHYPPGPSGHVAHRVVFFRAGDDRGIAGCRQRVSSETQRAGIAVDYQDARLLALPRRIGRNLRGDVARLAVSGGYRECNCRAFTRSGTVSTDAASVRLHQTLTDGESEALTGRASGAADVLVEQVPKQRRIDARALVGDRHRDVGAVAFCGDADGGGLGRLARGVGDEVAQHLGNAASVSQHVG